MKRRIFQPATDGIIAASNLESARQAAWGQFWRTPEHPGTAERILEQEQLALHFLGDHSALTRLEMLADRCSRAGLEIGRSALIRAQVASAAHRFADARSFVAQAEAGGANPEVTHRLLLAVDQACGTRLDAVLAERRRAAADGGLENLVPLGALLADLGQFDEANAIYRRALREYRDVSPFALAWVCFLLGVLWGELATEPQSHRAAQWYENAITYLPGYVKARIHLAEIFLREGRTADAHALLVAAAASGDPEAHWRLADVLFAMESLTEADTHMLAARRGFEELLQRHELAFADHAVEFYSGSGQDAPKARELARSTQQTGRRSARSSGWRPCNDRSASVYSRCRTRGHDAARRQSSIRPQGGRAGRRLC